MEIKLFFETEDLAQMFMSYLADGGGEQQLAKVNATLIRSGLMKEQISNFFYDWDKLAVRVSSIPVDSGAV